MCWAAKFAARMAMPAPIEWPAKIIFLPGDCRAISCNTFNTHVGSCIPRALHVDACSPCAGKSRSTISQHACRNGSTRVSESHRDRPQPWITTKIGAFGWVDFAVMRQAGHGKYWPDEYCVSSNAKPISAGSLGRPVASAHAKNFRGGLSACNAVSAPPHTQSMTMASANKSKSPQGCDMDYFAFILLSM